MAPRRRAPRPRLRTTLLALVLAAVGLAVLAGIDLWRVRGELARGRDRLGALDFRRVDEAGGVRVVAADAAAHLARADRIAHHSPWLSLTSHVPVLGNQVDAVRDLAATADRVGAIGTGTAERVQAAIDTASTRGPAGRVPLVDEVRAAAADLRAALATVTPPQRTGLLPLLSSAQASLRDDLAKADRQLADADRSLAAAHSLLAGPRRLLILGGNNAEMRSAAIATTAGIATISNGSIDVGDFVQTADVNLAPPGVPLTEEWRALYEWLSPGRAYSSTVMSPNFPLAAAMSSQISLHNFVGHVDGVVFVDTISLQRLLQLIGPVSVDGETYDGTNVTRKLLNENYLRFPTTSDSPERREAQSRVAKQVFEAIDERPIPLLQLASTLQDLGKSRHLMAWSADPAEQQLFVDTGVDGSLEPHDLLIASQNLNASKLDYYVTMRVDGAVYDEGDDHAIDLAVTLTDPKHFTGSSYIEGGGIYAAPGEYASFLVAYLPPEAYDLQIPGYGVGRAGPDGPVHAYSTVVRVPEGTSATVHFRFRLPDSVDEVRIMPAGRLVPTTYKFGTYTTSDLFPNPLDLDAVAVHDAAAVPWFVVGLLLFAAGAALMGDAKGRLAVAAAVDPGSRVARRARIDRKVGWLVLAVGLAMMAGAVALQVVRLR